MKLIVGAGAAILDHKRRILLIRRSFNKETFPGCWTFPIGRIEPTDSTLKATAIREVKEEVALDFTPKKKLGFYESQSGGRRFINLTFLGTWTGKVKIQESEISEFGWFSYEETQKLELAFAYSHAIKDLHEQGLL